MLTALATAFVIIVIAIAILARNKAKNKVSNNGFPASPESQRDQLDIEK